MPNVVVHDLATLTAGIISECEEDADFSDLFVAEIPNFIRRAESRCYGDLNLELFERIETGTLTASTKTQPIRDPEVQAIRSLYIQAPTPADSPWNPVLRRSYDFCHEYDADDPTIEERPLYYSELDEDNLYLSQSPDVAYNFRMRVTMNDGTLHSVIDTDPDPTWLSRNMGDLLLFASIVEAMRWLQANADEMAPYEGQYQGRLTIDKLTVRETVRSGDYTPVADSAKTVSDSQ